ncbi:MAG: outer membrane beta-barrel protein [Treponema sp.]|nr:outer membrane beta-barrel protein [Treponema sp.]
MKKLLAVLFLAALVAGGAFAQLPPMSAGGGVILDMSFGNGVKNGHLGYKSQNQNVSFGGFAFFDITYAEVSIDFAYGSTTNSPLLGSNVETKGNVMQLGISALGKYPIEIGSFTLFPLVGVEYNMVLSGKFHNYKKDIPNTKAMDFSQFGILAGAGVNYPIMRNLYIRGEVLVNIRFASKFNKDYADIVDGKTTLGFGPRVKVGVGYSF